MPAPKVTKRKSDEAVVAAAKGDSLPGKGTKRKASTSASAGTSTGTSKQEEDAEDRIANRVSRIQLQKACSALLAHRERQRKTSEANELPLEGEDDDEAGFGEGARSVPSDVVWMQITVKTLNANAPAKPIRIALPNAIYPKSSSVCLLTADPQRTYKDLMVAQRCTQVKRVVGATKLKGKFAPYEARRQLMNDHDLFLADDRIVPMLPKLLGKKWMAERKSPIPIQLTKTSDDRVAKQVTAALASTFFHRNKGTCASVRLGTVRHLTAEQLVQNAAACLPVIVGKHVKGGWENVQSIDIKTGTSAALPVWNCNVSERWTGMPEKKEEDEAATEAVETEETVSKKPKTSSSKNSKALISKRSAPTPVAAKAPKRKTAKA